MTWPLFRFAMHGNTLGVTTQMVSSAKSTENRDTLGHSLNREFVGPGEDSAALADIQA